MVLEQPYGKNVDWWAVGCIMYEMFCGVTPFFGTSTAVTCQKIVEGVIHYWPEDIPADAQDLIEKLLSLEQERIGNVEMDGLQVKQHAFFAGIWLCNIYILF